MRAVDRASSQKRGESPSMKTSPGPGVLVSRGVGSGVPTARLSQ